MERDFMGLNSVKEDASDGVDDSAVTLKAQGTRWPLGNKVAAVPHFLSHLSAHEDTPNKTASSCFTQNLAGNFLLKPSLSAGSIADSRNKSAVYPAQMTIFYKGTVKVYDSITPEKAQAIMFLARNASGHEAHTGGQIRPSRSKFDTNDVVVPVSQHANCQPSSAITSPISVSSHTPAQSVSSSTNTIELVTYKSTSMPLPLHSKMDTPITAFGSAAAPSMIQPGIPQFRKVSLARFLEKRKERAMNAVPYNAAKKPECPS